MKYFIFILFFAATAFSQTVEDVIVSCNTCHGEKGMSNNSLWPNLAGQKKDYLIKQLKEFRSDQRKDPVMNPMTKNLSDDDITKISDYFSNIKVEVK